MRPCMLLFFCSLLLGGCRTEVIDVSDAFCVSRDLATTSQPPDMTPPPAACPASKGLTGDNLFCANFAEPQTTIASLTAKGWDFGAGMSNCPGWQIMNSLLQVQNFSSFANGTCGFTPQLITAAQIQKYRRLTLSVQQRIDLNDPEQTAQIFLNNAADPQNLMWQLTGKKNVARQQTTVTVDTADLPLLVKSGFKWVLQINSQLAVGRNGWQIESLAVNGSL